MASRSLVNCLQKTSLTTRNSILRFNSCISTSTLRYANVRSSSSSSPSSSANYNSSPSTTSSSLLTSRSSHMYINKRYFQISTTQRSDSIIVDAPEFAESVKEGNITFVKQIGDSVKEDELIAEVETDKTTMEIKSPAAGVIEAFLVEDGSTIAAKTPVLKIKAGSGASAGATASSTPTASAAEAPKQAEVAAPKQAEVAAPAKPTQPGTVPPVPKAPASSVPIAKVPVTPFNLQQQQQAKNVDINKIGGTRTETRVKMSKMRQTVANRLKESQNTCAMLTTFNEVNMENLMSMRKSFGDQFVKKHGLKLGFMSAFVKSSAYALQDQPIVNAVIDGNEIVYRDFVDVSVAVATPKGLVVPVLRNVERMNFADIEKEIASLGERARNNKLAIEDMQGGTFTISNGGVFGSMFGTPIINLPQSSILGMHAIIDRPIAVNGQVVIKPMMYVALTYDHRLIDGREAVTFLKKIKSTIEDPRMLLLDI